MVGKSIVLYQELLITSRLHTYSMYSTVIQFSFAIQDYANKEGELFVFFSCFLSIQNKQFRSKVIGLKFPPFAIANTRSNWLAENKVKRSDGLLMPIAHNTKNPKHSAGTFGSKK
jgi:hypothetical protein